MVMFNSKGNMFLETERPEQKRTLCSRTHGQAAGCVVCEQRHPGRMMRDPCACPRSSRSLNHWGGSDITHCAVGQPWTLLGVFSSPCSYRRRHMEKRKWVKKRCIGEQGAFPRVSAHPRHMHGTCQSSTSWVQYSPKCRLSPGVDSVSVDLELAPEAGVCCLSGVLGHRTKARWGNLEVPGTVVPPRPRCGEAQVSFWLVSRALVTLTPLSSSGQPRVSLF